MSKRSKKGPGSRPIIMLLAIGAMGLGALGAYVKMAPADKVPAAQRRQEPPAAPIIDRQGTRDEDGGGRTSRNGTRKQVFVPKVDGEKVKLVRVDLQGKDEKLFVVNRTLDALKLEGAEAKKIDLAGGIAKVDLNEAILSGMGSMEEGTLLKALQMALGQFKEVELFQVTIDGKPVESLGGHLEWYDPQPVIRPAGSAAATQP